MLVTGRMRVQDIQWMNRQKMAHLRPVEELTYIECAGL